MPNPRAGDAAMKRVVESASKLIDHEVGVERMIHSHEIASIQEDAAVTRQRLVTEKGELEETVEMLERQLDTCHAERQEAASEVAAWIRIANKWAATAKQAEANARLPWPVLAGFTALGGIVSFAATAAVYIA